MVFTDQCRTRYFHLLNEIISLHFRGQNWSSRSFSLPRMTCWAIRTAVNRLISLNSTVIWIAIGRDGMLSLVKAGDTWARGRWLSSQSQVSIFSDVITNYMPRFHCFSKGKCAVNDWPLHEINSRWSLAWLCFVTCKRTKATLLPEVLRSRWVINKSTLKFSVYPFFSFFWYLLLVESKEICPGIHIIVWIAREGSEK